MILAQFWRTEDKPMWIKLGERGVCVELRYTQDDTKALVNE